MEAKKAFMSTRMMARSQNWLFMAALPVTAQLPHHHSLDAHPRGGVDEGGHRRILGNEFDQPILAPLQPLEGRLLVVDERYHDLAITGGVGLLHHHRVAV